MASDSVKLKEILDTSKIKNKNYEELLKIVMEIFSKNRVEAPNSATFSMAIDALERNGKLYVVKKKKMEYEEIPEIVELR